MEIRCLFTYGADKYITGKHYSRNKPLFLMFVMPKKGTSLSFRKFRLTN